MGTDLPLLEVEHLVAGYGALTVLHDLSLHIRAGEVVGLLGANGAGKTTLVRTLCGLLPPRAGRVLKRGIDLASLPAHRLASQGIAVALEGRNLFGEMTVIENLALALRVRREPGPGAVRFGLDEVLSLFPVLSEKRRVPARLLSGGQQQMVAIGRALLLQPELLILDEPSTGLAPIIIKDIMSVLHRLKARGLSMLLVEQNVGMAAALTDRAYVLSLGRIVHQVREGQWEHALRSGEIVGAYLGGGPAVPAQS